MAMFNQANLTAVARRHANFAALGESVPSRQPDDKMGATGRGEGGRGGGDDMGVTSQVRTWRRRLRRGVCC